MQSFQNKRHLSRCKKKCLRFTQKNDYFLNEPCHNERINFPISEDCETWKVTSIPPHYVWTQRNMSECHSVYKYNINIRTLRLSFKVLQSSSRRIYLRLILFKRNALSNVALQEGPVDAVGYVWNHMTQGQNWIHII
jgi:hypothetical protein